MLIAISGNDLPKIGKVQAIPSNLQLNSEISIHWMTQERAPHKPKWLRYFKLATCKNAQGEAQIQDIILYGFDLTNKGALKKRSRMYLQNAYASSS